MEGHGAAEAEAAAAVPRPAAVNPGLFSRPLGPDHFLRYPPSRTNSISDIQTKMPFSADCYSPSPRVCPVGIPALYAFSNHATTLP